MGTDALCLGNGQAAITYQDGTTATLQPGDVIPSASIERVTLIAADGETPILRLNLRGEARDSDAAQIALVAFGEVWIENPSAPLLTLNALTTGAANIRQQPRADAPILARFNVNDGAILDGRTSDGVWLRVRLPNSDQSGWLAREVVNAQGNIEALAILDETSPPPETPFSRIVWDVSAAPPLCDGALSAGILMQTPDPVDPVILQPHWGEFRFAGTMYISHGLGLAMIQGFAALDQTTYVPAGARTSGNGVVPYSPDALSTLPLTSLPRVAPFPAPITEAEIAAAQAAFVTVEQPTPTPAPTLPAEDTTCRRIVQRDSTLYAGAGDFYEAINEIEAGASVDPVFQTRDPDGGVWWQLRGSNWIAAALVRETGNCQPIPLMDRVVPPSNNTLSLETCESSNGPVRAGQQVEIYFTPPAFQSYAEAEQAPRIDPGQITIGARTYRATAGEPIRLGTVGTEDRYLRRFSLYWRASAGTHRIVGERLSYIPICTITVPVG
jgi:hypothetical protein